MKVCILGAGNVASHLSRAFAGATHLVSVWNRTEASLRPIGEAISCFCTTNMELLPKDADVYLISVKDDAVEEVARALKDALGDSQAVVAHTAGSVAKAVLERNFVHCGVLYPMQTFSKAKQLDYSQIPFFIEAEGAARTMLRNLAQSVSDAVYDLSGELRKKLHLASVFACNFANHCLAISEDILREIELPFSVMSPLLRETLHKATEMSPRQAQTGPAVREDAMVMNEHLGLLDHRPEEKEIYRALSQNIIKYKKHD